MDYAQAVSTERGRCFRWVYDDTGKPTNCPGAVIASGWLRIDRWYEVDACAEHSGQLRFRGSLNPPLPGPGGERPPRSPRG
jgi:hypothetical protein